MDLKIWVNCEIRNLCNFLKNKSCLYQFSIHCDQCFFPLSFLNMVCVRYLYFLSLSSSTFSYKYAFSFNPKVLFKGYLIMYMNIRR